MGRLRDLFFAVNYARERRKYAGAGDPGEDNIDQLRGMTFEQAQASGDFPGAAMSSAATLGGQQLATTLGNNIHELRRAAQLFQAFKEFLKKSTPPGGQPAEFTHMVSPSLDEAWQAFLNSSIPHEFSPADAARTKAIMDHPANLSRLEAFAATIARQMDPGYEMLHREAHLRQVVAESPSFQPAPPAGQAPQGPPPQGPPPQGPPPQPAAGGA